MVRIFAPRNNSVPPSPLSPRDTRIKARPIRYGFSRITSTQDHRSAKQFERKINFTLTIRCFTKWRTIKMQLFAANSWNVVTSRVLYRADADYEFVSFHCPSSLLPTPPLASGDSGNGKRKSGHVKLRTAARINRYGTLYGGYAVDTSRARAKSGMRSSRSPLQMRIGCLWRISWQEEN